MPTKRARVAVILTTRFEWGRRAEAEEPVRRVVLPVR